MNAVTEKVLVIFATLVYDNVTVSHYGNSSDNQTVDYYYDVEDVSVLNHSMINATSNYGAPIRWSFSKVGLLFVSILVIANTVLGNLLVVMSVATEKKLQTPFNYYVLNLAVSDMNVGLSVMILYTVNNLYDYFPLNNYWCGFWVWADYTMTFESVFTLCVISIDRFWSVTWTIHYRNSNSGRKSFLIIIATWVTVNTIWLPSFVYDRLVNTYDKGDCQWNPGKNISRVIYMGALGYYTPLITMLLAYSRIFYVMRKRMQVASLKAGNTLTVPTVAYRPASDENSSDVTAAQPETKIPKAKNPATIRANKERKAFMTLGHIVVCFLICWLPFYVLFIIDPFFPDFFPDWYTEFAYWMAYLNSSFNPIIYAVSSEDFRRAFKRILTCGRVK